MSCSKVAASTLLVMSPSTILPLAAFVNPPRSASVDCSRRTPRPVDRLRFTFFFFFGSDSSSNDTPAALALGDSDFAPPPTERGAAPFCCPLRPWNALPSSRSAVFSRSPWARACDSVIVLCSTSRLRHFSSRSMMCHPTSASTPSTMTSST